jgi:general secretion pathway protein I
LGQSTELEGDLSRDGFTLIEALAALAVVAVALSAIGMLVAANIRATRSLDHRLTLLETTRAILSGLPGRNELELGRISGEMADHRWRVDVIPFSADFIDPNTPSPWIPQSVVLRVQAPTGEILRIDTVRLHRNQGSSQ